MQTCHWIPKSAETASEINSVSTQRPWHRISLQLRLVIMNMQILMLSNELTPASRSRAGCSVAVEAATGLWKPTASVQGHPPPLTSLGQISSPLPYVGSGWQSLTMECSRAGHGPRMPLSKETKAMESKGQPAVCRVEGKQTVPSPSET